MFGEISLIYLTSNKSNQQQNNISEKYSNNFS